ncbi:hypothetical protein BRADI_4g12690v3 [Brachypodium distachyon]|uniref:Uncharacterized protein n=1 Tax=Brachypodium distachyon TaxID=15368 RepID=I1IK35_BRADI|nr:hypothetical protein BRADI_4g12690v3 [Brachypodium distachyon]
MASAAYQPSGLSSQQQNARSPATTSDWASGREATATGVAPVCGSAEALSGLGDRRADIKIFFGNDGSTSRVNPPSVQGEEHQDQEVQDQSPVQDDHI